MNVTYQNKTLLESCSFITLGLGETTVQLGTQPENLTFVFDFKKDEAEKSKQGFTAKAVDDKTIRLELTNWDNGLGTTLKEAIEVGVFRNRKLFLILFVRKAGQGEFRAMTISFYLGEEVRRG